MVLRFCSLHFSLVDLRLGLGLRHVRTINEAHLGVLPSPDRLRVRVLSIFERYSLSLVSFTKVAAKAGPGSLMTISVARTTVMTTSVGVKFAI